MADGPVFKQLVAVIDGRTTVICLEAAGQIQPAGKPYDTLNGSYETPPFHLHCRSISVPWMPGFVDDIKQRADAELMRRPARIRAQADGRHPVTIPKPDRVVVGKPTGRWVADAKDFDVKAFTQRYLDEPKTMERELTGGSMSDSVRLYSTPSGRWVVKAVDDAADREAEVLYARLLHAFGVDDLKTSVLGKNRVLMSYIESDVGWRAQEQFSRMSAEELAALPNAKITSLLDWVLGQVDRHGGNWVLSNGRVVPIDNSYLLSLRESGWMHMPAPPPWASWWYNARPLSGQYEPYMTRDMRLVGHRFEKEFLQEAKIRLTEQADLFPQVEVGGKSVFRVVMDRLDDLIELATR